MNISKGQNAVFSEMPKAEASFRVEFIGDSSMDLITLQQYKCSHIFGKSKWFSSNLWYFIEGWRNYLDIEDFDGPIK